MNDVKPVKELTGRKVLMILLAAFGTIFAVNMTLLYQAVNTFPGLEVKNSYVASQTFDDRAIAQRALGWVPEVKYANGQMNLSIFSNGQFVFPETIEVRVGRPTHGREDANPVLLRDANGYWFKIDLNDGKWFIYVNAETASGEPFAQRLEILVADGNG
ncbi:MAG: nitrogen fixation protein FixH [Rhodobacteraceae bacterium]|nr:MAG: nitrogen fixation protein FixH [Paracoccaceae bacterium]